MRQQLQDTGFFFAQAVILHQRKTPLNMVFWPFLLSWEISNSSEILQIKMLSMSLLLLF